MNDVVGERSGDVRKVREFLYVDHQRIRSYYSQINRGVIESVISRGSGGASGEVGVRLFGFGPSVTAERGNEREESRSLQDLNYVIFEELFENEGLIKDITDEADDLDAWKTGQLHSELDEGDIVKYTGNIQVLDPDFVRDRFNQYGKLAVALAGTQVGAQEPEGPTPPVRQRGSTKAGRKARTAEEVRQDLIAQKLEEFSGGISLGQLASISDFIGAFTNNAITARVLPLAENPEYHFAGTLLSRSEYIQPEREALFGRYGTSLEDWTIVMQVARIPSPEVSQTPDFSEPFASKDAINRGMLESMVGRLMKYMESLGVAEGARYPAISVTVLAIY
jgi:hypothetical protein